MSFYIPDDIYFLINESIKDLFGERAKVDVNRLVEQISFNAKEIGIDSPQIENFVRTSCAATYFAAMAATEEIMKGVLFAVSAAARDAALTESNNPQENADT